MEDGAVRVQCPHGGDPVTVLPTPGRKDPCPHRIYVHRCMKVADATVEHDLLPVSYTHLTLPTICSV
eukprot:6819015-Prorocentrum_lima.AAC.1